MQRAKRATSGPTPGQPPAHMPQPPAAWLSCAGCATAAVGCRKAQQRQLQGVGPVHREARRARSEPRLPRALGCYSEVAAGWGVGDGPHDSHSTHSGACLTPRPPSPKQSPRKPWTPLELTWHSPKAQHRAAPLWVLI